MTGNFRVINTAWLVREREAEYFIVANKLFQHAGISVPVPSRVDGRTSTIRVNFVSTSYSHSSSSLPLGLLDHYGIIYCNIGTRPDHSLYISVNWFGFHLFAILYFSIDCYFTSVVSVFASNFADVIFKEQLQLEWSASSTLRDCTHISVFWKCIQESAFFFRRLFYSNILSTPEPWKTQNPNNMAQFSPPRFLQKYLKMIHLTNRNRF